MLRRDLLKALAAFIAAGPAVAAATENREPEAGGFTPPTAPAEPQPAVFGSVQPSYITSHLSPQMLELRDALLHGSQLPVDIVLDRDGRTVITFFPPEAAKRLGTTEALQAKAIDIIERRIPTTAVIYNGGAACEVWFRRVD